MDWKVRFFGSVLGYVWSLLRPLLLFGILYLVFSEVVGAGDGVEHYPIVLLSGMMLYFFYGEVTGAATTSLVDREALVRKVGFPRMVVPLAVALVGVVQPGAEPRRARDLPRAERRDRPLDAGCSSRSRSCWSASSPPAPGCCSPRSTCASATSSRSGTSSSRRCSTRRRSSTRSRSCRRSPSALAHVMMASPLAALIQGRATCCWAATRRRRPPRSAARSGC